MVAPAFLFLFVFAGCFSNRHAKEGFVIKQLNNTGNTI